MNEIEEIFDVARQMGESANKVQGYVAEIKQLLFEYTKSIEEIGNIPERTCDNCYYGGILSQEKSCISCIKSGEIHKYHKFSCEIEEPCKQWEAKV